MGAEDDGEEIEGDDGDDGKENSLSPLRPPPRAASSSGETPRILARCSSHDGTLEALRDADIERRKREGERGRERELSVLSFSKN